MQAQEYIRCITRPFCAAQVVQHTLYNAGAEGRHAADGKRGGGVPAVRRGGFNLL